MTVVYFFFFFNDTATTEIYTLSLHDALPILRTERIERRICRSVAEFAFRLAERTGAKVFGGPKYTVSPVYEGMLKEEMDAAAERHQGVPYEPQLIDATFALLVGAAGDPLVIPALNREIGRASCRERV